MEPAIESLFYALSGLDTAHLSVNESLAELQIDGIPKYLVDPFDFIIRKVHEYYGDEDTACFIGVYLQHINSLIGKATSLEQLYVELQPDIEIFRDLDRAKLIINNSADPFKELKAKEKEFKSECIYKHFIQQQSRIRKECIESWANWAEIVPTSSDSQSLIEIREIDGFDGSYWKDKHRIKDIGMPATESKAIEESGRIIELIRKVFGKEIVDETDEDSIKPFRYGIDNIIERNINLLNKLSELMGEQINYELNMLNNIIFMQDLSSFYFIFSVFHDEFLMPVKMSNSFAECDCASHTLPSRIASLMPSNSVEISFSLSSLQEYVLKMLKSQRIAHPNSYVVVAESLRITMKLSYLNYFVSKRVIAEIEMISRFLLLVNILIYYLDRTKKYNFTRIIYLILLKLKDNPIKPINLAINNPIKGCTQVFDINEMVALLEKQVKELLDSFFLTNPDIFYFIARLFDVALEFVMIEFPDALNVESFNVRIKEIVAGLSASLKNHTGDSEFHEYIEGTEYARLL